MAYTPNARRSTRVKYSRRGVAVGLEKKVLTFQRYQDESKTMHRFVRIAPLDLQPQPDPGPDHRVGPPLSRGSLFSLLATVASEDLPQHALEQLRHIDPEAWYLGQDFESMINLLEDKDPTLPELMGRNLYFMLRTQFQKLGVLKVSQLFERIPSLWIFVTRGDSGVWRSQQLGERHFYLELEQPYHCGFEMGAMRGFIEAYDGFDVRIKKEKCLRRGDPCCAFDVRWSE